MTDRPTAASKWLERAAIFAVPAAAGLAVAVTIVGGARERPALGARVHGLPVAGTDRWALRIETLRAERGLVRAAAAGPLHAELTCQGTSVATWAGRSDARGIAEAVLHWSGDGADCGGPNGFRLEVRGGQARLAEGPVTALPPPPLEAIEPLDGTGRGPLALSISLPRGAAVASLPERVEIAAVLPATIAGIADGCATAGYPTPELARLPRVTLELSVKGGTVAPKAPEPSPHCEAGAVTLRWHGYVVAEAPPVELEITARADGLETSSWHGELPVVLGWSWADERAVEHGQLRVRSVSAQPMVYASLVSAAGRLWGQPLGLRLGGDGLTEHEQPLPALPNGAVELRLSSDPTEPPGTTARWPLRPELGALPTATLSLLVDGMPAAEQAARRRQQQARLPAVTIVAAAGLFEIAYLLGRYRRSRQRAVRAVGQANRPAGDRNRMVAEFSLLWLAVLGGGVTVAFVALAALAFWG